MLHLVIWPLLENEVGPISRGQDVLKEIRLVDVSPDLGSYGLGFLVSEIGIPLKV